MWQSTGSTVRVIAQKILESDERSRGHAARLPSVYSHPTSSAAGSQGVEDFTLVHFIHIPWPGAEDWAILPPGMRHRILESLCSVDLLGLQTREDALNFIRTCESNLERVHVNFKTWPNMVPAACHPCPRLPNFD
jgi:hypothetical protein